MLNVVQVQKEVLAKETLVSMIGNSELFLRTKTKISIHLFIFFFRAVLCHNCSPCNSSTHLDQQSPFIKFCTEVSVFMLTWLTAILGRRWDLPGRVLMTWLYVHHKWFFPKYVGDMMLHTGRFTKRFTKKLLKL